MSLSTYTPYAGRRVALITGSAQGIGRAIALRLANDGYSVGLNDIPANLAALEALSAEINQRARENPPVEEWVAQKTAILCADVSDESAVRTMVESCVKELGRLDVVCSLQIAPLLFLFFLVLRC